MAEEQSTEERRVPLDWYFPEGTASRYATNIVVQRQPHEYIISFFEVQHPILVGTREERETQLAQIGAVPALCVARIIVAPDRFPKFVDALQRQLAPSSGDDEPEELG